MLSGRYTYSYDIVENRLKHDCNINPTDISQDVTHWLYAVNNKHENPNYEKIGKWMLFLSRETVNPVWDKIKMAIRDGHLWHSKVSTTTTESGRTNHAIMIYTKDYTDKDDVINVLNFLESSSIKPPHVTIRYKTDQQTRAGVYSGGAQKPWIYSSETIREAAAGSWRTN